MSSVLKDAGFKTELVQFDSESDLATLTKAVLEAHPSLVVFSLVFAETLEIALHMSTALRLAGSDAHLTLAGHLPSLAHSAFLNHCEAIDSIILGEPEAVVERLAAAVLDGVDWRKLAGVATRGESQFDEHPAPVVTSLNQLPFPDRGDGIHFHSGYGFATVEASRGCYYDCAFCLPSAYYRKLKAPHRPRDISSLVDEIEQLHSLGVRLITFDDDQFLSPSAADIARVSDLEAELGSRRLNMAFTIKCRPDDVERGLFARLKKIGLGRVYVGIESGSQATLDLFQKRVTVSRNEYALALLDSLGILADFRILIFHPWSTFETVSQDLAFLMRVLPNVSTCFNFREVEIFPGTGLYLRLLREARLRGNPWLPVYSIMEPEAEVLRRISRFVFDSRGAHHNLEETLNLAWFDHLVDDRFNSSPSTQTRGRVLKSVATRANRLSLGIWNDMIEFARMVDPRDAARVNSFAEACAWRITNECLSLQSDVA